jgi:hypothetical protein
MKALSNVVAFAMIIVIFLGIFIPFYLTYEYVSELGLSTTQAAESPSYYKQAENEFISSGILRVSYYSLPEPGGEYFNIISFYTNRNILINSGQSLNVVGIYYFNSTKSEWVLLNLKYPINITLLGPYSIQFYTKVPIYNLIIFTNYGNIIYLSINSTTL